MKQIFLKFSGNLPEIKKVPIFVFIDESAMRVDYRRKIEDIEGLCQACDAR